MGPDTATCPRDNARRAMLAGTPSRSTQAGARHRERAELTFFFPSSPLISAIAVLSSSPSSPVSPPSATVDATTAASTPPSSSSSHRLRPCLPAIVQPLLPLPSFSSPPTTSLVPSSVLTPDHLASVVERHRRLPPTSPASLSLSAVPAIHRHDLSPLSSPSPPPFPLSLFPSVHCTSSPLFFPTGVSPPPPPQIGRLHCSRHIADDRCLHLPSSLLRSLLFRRHNPSPLPCFARLLSSPTTLSEPGIDPPPFPNRAVHHRCCRRLTLHPCQRHGKPPLPFCFGPAGWEKTGGRRWINGMWAESQWAGLG